MNVINYRINEQADSSMVFPQSPCQELDYLSAKVNDFSGINSAPIVLTPGSLRYFAVAYDANP